mmetsp:Transcript_3886/g.11236  ORF Transcript_3886/g.11236 Transcript_3886/m.11236 type:complete len:261 (+) Transcript_3886:3316-4098(+)
MSPNTLASSSASSSFSASPVTPFTIRGTAFSTNSSVSSFSMMSSRNWARLSAPISPLASASSRVPFTKSRKSLSKKWTTWSAASGTVSFTNSMTGAKTSVSSPTMLSSANASTRVSSKNSWVGSTITSSKAPPSSKNSGMVSSTSVVTGSSRSPNASPPSLNTSTTGWNASVTGSTIWSFRFSSLKACVRASMPGWKVALRASSASETILSASFMIPCQNAGPRAAAGVRADDDRRSVVATRAIPDLRCMVEFFRFQVWW